MPHSHDFTDFIRPRPCPPRAIRSLCLSLLAATACFGEEPVRFSGKVVDGAGAGVPWAIIHVEGGDILGQSAADGAFSLTGNSARIIHYPDPRPSSPASAQATGGPAVSARYLLDGRVASGFKAASVFLQRPSAEAEASAYPPSGYPALAQRTPSGDARPPAPPLLEKSAAGYGLTVSMAHYRTESFPQAGASAQNLVLTLARSATDTAAYAAEKKLCLDTLNAYRAKLGLKGLAWSVSLEAFADQGARFDSERGVAHGHFSAFSKGAVPSDAENAVPGWPLKSYRTVAAVVAKGAEMMWAEGPGGGHYENIRGGHTQVGCGIYVTADGGVWVVHDFK